MTNKTEEENYNIEIIHEVCKNETIKNGVRYYIGCEYVDKDRGRQIIPVTGYRPKKELKKMLDEDMDYFFRYIKTYKRTLHKEKTNGKRHNKNVQPLRKRNGKS